MSNLFRKTLVCLLAVFALSAVTAAGAQAVSWHVNSNPIGSSGKFAFKSTSGVSRLWVTSLKLVIVCKKDKDAGTLEFGGKDKVTVTYEECGLYEAVWNATTKEWEVGTQYTACKVPNIVVEKIVSQLTWGPGGILVNDFKPETGTLFVTITVEGASCALAKKYPVEGTVIAKFPPAQINKEAVTGEQIFQVERKAAAGVTQIPTEYFATKTEGEENKGGKIDTLTFGSKAAALESVDTVELESKEVFGPFEV